MASSGDSSEDEDDSHFDYVINALYAEVIAREECGSHRVIFQEHQLLEGRECEYSQQTTVNANCFQDLETAVEDSDDEEEVENILREIYGQVDQQGGRMFIEEVSPARGLLPSNIQEQQENQRNVVQESVTFPQEGLQRQVEASPPPANLAEVGESAFNLEVSDFLYLHASRPFFNNKFNVRGTMYTVRIQDRPEVAERLDAFNVILRDLELSVLRQIPADDYVQLRFNSSDLANPFIVPVVKRSMFDARVASEMFARILPSNSEVDVGRGDFSIDVYHTHIPQGGGKVKEFGKTIDKLLKTSKSVIRVPKEVAPHCLVIAMKTAALALEKKHKHFLRISRKRQLYKLIQYAKQVRKDCGLPMAGELKVTDITKLVQHGDFCDHPVTVFSRKNQFSPIFSANNHAGGKGLALILSDHHFDVVTSLPAFMQKHGRGLFCHKCQKFERKKRHICDAQVCTMCKCFCGGVDANNPLEHIRCAECGRGFLNRRCYEMHKQPYCAAVDNRPTCNRIYACPKCHRDLKIVRGQRSNKNQWNGKPHECYKSYCNICKQNVNK